ncbi:MAG: TRAP transporter TatT component family protein [Bdellovibrionota bacterium]
MGAGKAEASALVEEGNRAFRHQAEEKELRRAIELFQRAFAIDPYYPGLGGQLGYAYYLLADNVIPFEKEDERQDAYRLGRDYALKGLEANGMMRDVLQKSGDLQDAIAFSTKDDLGAMYWAAINWGRWGEIEGILKLGLAIPKIKALNERVLELDESYSEYGVHRFFGAYWVKVPIGKDLEKSKWHFERSIEKAPHILLGKVMMAEYYAQAMDDRPLFVNLLSEVLAVPEDPADPFILMNRGARRRAKELLGQVDDIF